jgi:type II secretion system protein L
VLGIMLPKSVLKQQLEMLAAAGLDPQAIVPSPVGLAAISRMVPTQGTVLIISGTDLCLKNNETVIAFRSFSASQATGAAAHTLKALENAYGLLVEKVLVLNGEHSAEWENLGLVLEHVTPEYNGKKSEEPVSLGLALSGEINFRKGEYAYRLADEGTRKRKRTLIVAGVIAALLAVTNLGVKITVVQSGYGRLDREIKGIYQQLFPQEPMPGDPLRYLRDKLANARKQFGVLGSGSSALDAMRAVTEGIPKEVRVSFSEFNLEGDRLKLQGDAPSFESVDKIKAELQKVPSFGEVTVLDTRMGVDSKVKFRLDIKIKQTS